MSGTTRVSRYQKGKTRKVKTNLDLLKQESGWQWHLLGYMQVCTPSQTTTPTSHHSVFTGRMPFLPPNQQHQSTDHQSSFICFLHLLWSRASSMFNIICLGLAPSGLHFMLHTFLHPTIFFFMQHMPICNLLCCSTEIMSSNRSLSLNSILGTLSFTLTSHIK